MFQPDFPISLLGTHVFKSLNLARFFNPLFDFTKVRHNFVFHGQVAGLYRGLAVSKSEN